MLKKLPFYACIALLFATYANSTDYWKVEPGASTMKMLSLPSEPRQAALAGAGIASPKGVGEAMRNPLAATTANSFVLSFSKTEFSNLIGASRMSMLAHSMFGNWHLTAGMESLNYNEIQGYTEDGLTADGLTFTPSTIAAQLGIARTFNLMSMGLTTRYANQNIDDYNEHGILFDGGVKFERELPGMPFFMKKIAFGAVFNNFGWIFSDSEVEEIAPLFFQAGITDYFVLPLEHFSFAVSIDLYRRTDSDPELRYGFEFMYKELFSLRFGFPYLFSDKITPSAGFAVKLGFADIEYAYQNNAVLEANHIFGVSIYF